MRTNSTYKSLVDKSVNSMLSAIEIYNKPNFSYREETFAILAVNAQELLFKAKLLKLHRYNLRCLHILEAVKTKNGNLHKKNKQPKTNRSGNAQTIGLFEVINNLDTLGFKLTKNHLSNIEALVELRDNAIHFHNENHISKEIQEIGFATIKNYLHIIKLWDIDVDLTSYNLYLMPLAYVDSKVISTGVITDEVSNYLNFVKTRIDNEDKNDDDFDIAISIDISFKKENSFGELGFKYEDNGIPIKLTEENIKEKYPLTHGEVCRKAKLRYTNFKQNGQFHSLLSKIKEDPKLSHQRLLDPDNPKSSNKPFYNSNIWKVLDKYYKK